MNIPQTLAIQLSNSVPLGVEEKLFQQALSNVENRTSRGGIRPPFFDILQHARNVDDLNFALKSARESNKFWTEEVGKSWLKSVCKYAERILVYKGLMSSVAARTGTIHPASQ